MSLTVKMCATDLNDECQIVAIQCECCAGHALLLNSNKQTIRDAAFDKGWVLARTGWFCNKCSIVERYVLANEMRSGWNHVYQTWNSSDWNQDEYDTDDDYDENETDGFEHDCARCSKLTDLVETIENEEKLCFKCYADYEDGFEHQCARCLKLTNLVETIENEEKLCFECFADYEVENE